MKDNKRYWHFRCCWCAWQGIRYANQKTCPACNRKHVLNHLRIATKAERDAAFEETLRKWKEIPD